WNARVHRRRGSAPVRRLGARRRVSALDLLHVAEEQDRDVSARAERGFASDNAATVHPEVLAGLARANVGHASGYGHDRFTERTQALFAEHFGDQSQAFLVFNGSGAN